jgi:hypothetical protein
LTLNETHTFGPTVVSEARFGFNRIYGTLTPNTQLNPAELRHQHRRQHPIGLPQINIAGGLKLRRAGRPAVGRGDTTFVAGDVPQFGCVASLAQIRRRVSTVPQ